MAHGLEKNQNGDYECFVAGDPAWHNLGVNVSEAVSWQQALQLANLDWKVEKRQLEYAGEKVNAWGTFRADSEKFLGAVGPDYEPIQNQKGFDFTNSLFNNFDVKYESAGALFGGKRIWLLAQIPQDIRIVGTDDISHNYFLFNNRHDGQGGSAVGKLCNTRVVCNNTLQMALREDTSCIKIRHTRSQDEQLEKAKFLMENATEQIKDLDSLLNVLATVQVDMNTIQKILKTIYTKLETSAQEQNKARNVLEIFEDNDNNAFPSIRGTAFNLLNAFTQFEDHHSTSRVTDISENPEQARSRKALFGTGEIIKFQVLTAITRQLHEQQLASFNTNIVSL